MLKAGYQKSKRNLFALKKHNDVTPGITDLLPNEMAMYAISTEQLCTQPLR